VQKESTDETVISGVYLSSFFGMDIEQNGFRYHAELQTYKRDHSLNAEYTGVPVVKVNTVMRLTTTFRSTTGLIHDGGPIRL
jgi:hypothetical protein